MSKIKLNLKQFKHVSSDDKSTTLQHVKDGHTITMYHKALGPEAQEQLKSLANIAKDAATVPQSREKKYDSFAEGGKVKRIIPADEKADVEEPKKESVLDYTGFAQETQRKNKDIRYNDRSKPRKKYAFGEGNVSPDDSAPVADPIQPHAPVPAVPGVTNYTPDPTAPLADSNAPYQDFYNKTYNELKENDPNRPDETAREIALDMATKYKAQHESRLTEQQHDAAANEQKQLKENVQRQALGLSPVQQPTSMPQLPEQLPPAPPIAPPQAAPIATGAAPLPPSTGNGIAQGSPTDPEGALLSGYKESLQGISAAAKAQGDLGTAQAGMLQQKQVQDQKAIDAFQQNYSKLEEERQASIQDIKDGYINPDHYWTGDPKTGEGGHSKIAAGVGMILAGFNPTNSPNAAIGFLQKQMDMNLQAQAKNLDAKNNLLSHNLRQFGNLRDAADMTRIQQNDMLTHQLETAAATAKGPQAQAAAMQAAGQLKMATASLFQNFSMMHSIRSMASDPNGQNPDAQSHMIAQISAVNPEKGKMLSQAFVPGVGLTKDLSPVPDKVRSELVEHNKLSAAVHSLQDFMTKHPNLSDRLSLQNRAIAAQLVLPIQAAFREGTLGTVYREGEQPLLDKAVKGQPLELAQYYLQTEPKKLDQLLKSNDTAANVLKEGYNLPVHKAPPPVDQSQQALHWAQANINNPANKAKAQSILKALGR